MNEMKKYRIIHYENDGFNNVYRHDEGLEFANLEEAQQYLLKDFLKPIPENEIIDEDWQDDSYTITLHMFSEEELANSEIGECDEIPTELWTIEEETE